MTNTNLIIRHFHISDFLPDERSWMCREAVETNEFVVSLDIFFSNHGSERKGQVYLILTDST